MTSPLEPTQRTLSSLLNEYKAQQRSRLLDAIDAIIGRQSADLTSEQKQRQDRIDAIEAQIAQLRAQIDELKSQQGRVGGNLHRWRQARKIIDRNFEPDSSIICMRGGQPTVYGCDENDLENIIGRPYGSYSLDYATAEQWLGGEHPGYPGFLEIYDGASGVSSGIGGVSSGSGGASLSSTPPSVWP